MDRELRQQPREGRKRKREEGRTAQDTSDTWKTSRNGNALLDGCTQGLTVSEDRWNWGQGQNKEWQWSSAGA